MEHQNEPSRVLGPYACLRAASALVLVGSDQSMKEVKLNAVALTITQAIAVPLSAAKPKVAVERDRRTMNHMSPETKLVHARLEAWGKYARDNGIQGFPRQSLTEKAAQYGKLGIPQESNYRAESPMPEHIANVDGAVCRLWGVGQRCIKRYYIQWAPPEVMAKEEGMELRRFQEVLRRSRELIGMWLDDVERR